MKNKHELNIKIRFQIDDDFSDFETAKMAILTFFRNEMQTELAEDRIIEEGYSLDVSAELISVKDRLPEKQGYYLVRCPGSFPKNYRGIIAEFYEDSQSFYGESSEMEHSDATHWQELPNFDF